MHVGPDPHQGTEADHQREREQEVHQIRGHHRRREHLRGEPHLGQQVAPVADGARPGPDGGREPDPGQEAHEEEVGVVGDVALLDDAEDQRVHRHEEQRVHERPEEAQGRAAVARLQLALRQVPEERAVLPELLEALGHLRAFPVRRRGRGGRRGGFAAAGFSALLAFSASSASTRARQPDHLRRELGREVPHLRVEQPLPPQRLVDEQLAGPPEEPLRRHHTLTEPGAMRGDGQPHRGVLVLLERPDQERQRLEQGLRLVVHRQRVLADAARLEPLARGVEQGARVDVPSEQLHRAFTIASISSR